MYCSSAVVVGSLPALKQLIFTKRDSPSYDLETSQPGKLSEARGQNSSKPKRGSHIHLGNLQIKRHNNFNIEYNSSEALRISESQVHESGIKVTHEISVSSNSDETDKITA